MEYAFGKCFLVAFIVSFDRLLLCSVFYSLHVLCCQISEYLDDATLIPKNTSVLIRRVPGRPRMPIVTDPEYYLRSF